MVDIRINRGGASGKVPFGFVVFDSDEPVNKLLQLKVSGNCLHTHMHTNIIRGCYMYSRSVLSWAVNVL